jgi:hypothetical protein
MAIKGQKTTKAAKIKPRAKAAPKSARKSPASTEKAKHAGGRPPKFTEPAPMAELIDAYFASLKGRGDKPDRPPTMAGLALALGFLDRRSLTDYSERDEFFPLVKKARLRIEAHHEERLSGPNCTGSICWMNNHAGYVMRQEFSGLNGGPIEYSKLTPAERKARISALEAKRAGRGKA